MEHTYSFMMLIAGFVLLYFGAKSLIRGGASLALRLGLPILVIGLTVFGYGTGMPELIVSIEASLANRGDIAVGNVLGSNIANIGLILGLSAIIRPIEVKSQLIKLDGPIMVAAAFVLCLLIMFMNTIGRGVGFLLVIGLAFHTYYSLQQGKKEKCLEKEIEQDLNLEQFRSPIVDIFLIFLGFLLLFTGGKVFLSGAIAIAKYFNISDAVIGLTVVALGTSLPELATSLVAIFKRHGDIIVGNVVGSNIFNSLAIIGAASILNPISIREINWVDYTYMILITVFLWLIIHNRKHIDRLHGVIMLGSYVAYMLYLACFIH